MSNLQLTVGKPGDGFAPPIYEGDPNEAHTVLKPGMYSKALIEDLDTGRTGIVNVYVFETSTVLGRYVLVGGE